MTNHTKPKTLDQMLDDIRRAAHAKGYTTKEIAVAIDTAMREFAVEREDIKFVLCVPKDSERYYHDDVETECAFCGVPIIHRPFMPKTAKKICLDCGGKLSEQEHHDN
jgi:hypothetical protein